MAGSDNSKIMLRATSAEAASHCLPQTTDCEDQTALVQELGQRIVDSQKEIIAFLAGSLVKAIQIGQDLIAVRELLPAGAYLKWIDEQLTPISGISRRTAQRYSKLARNEATILERLGYESSDLASTSQLKLQAFRIEDGLRLLMSGSASVTVGQQDQPDTDGIVPDRIRGVALQVLNQSGFANDTADIQTVVLTDGLSEADFKGCPAAVFSIPDPRTNRKKVLQLQELHRSQTLSASMLWISGHGMSQWLPLLNAYPRVCVFETNAAAKPDRACWWLYGLIAPSMFHTFSSTVAHLGDVLIPYQSPSDLPLIPQNTKEQLDDFTIE